MSIREKRLENDFKELTAFVNNSGGKLAIISTQGQPPHQYVIEYHCRGIEKLQETEPFFRTNHSVEIDLGINYPKEMPTAKFLTPIFHPNVFSSLNVCLGSYWTMAETLTELVLRIGKIIQYANDVLNLNSPANSDAKNWAENNMLRFPLDMQTFKSTQKPSTTIIWNDF